MPTAATLTAARFASTMTKLVILGSAAAAIVLTTATAAPPVQSVTQVDVQRYAGMWYEVARAPNSFQAKCEADVTATYRPLPDGSIKVINRCRQSDDQWAVSVGKAQPPKGDSSGAKLKVSFLPNWLQWVPGTKADYWVVLLDPEYRFAVVSEPSREYVWILSRTPTMEPRTYDQIVERLREQGYPVDTLIPTAQQTRGQVPMATRRSLLI